MTAIRICWAVTLLLACGTSERPPEYADTEEPGVSEEPETAEGVPSSTDDTLASVTGSWTSERCGARTHERRVELRDDGSYRTEDRVDGGPAVFEGRWSFVRGGETGNGWAQRCHRTARACIFLDAHPSTEPSAELQASIPQYPAVLFFDDAPFESDGTGQVCRYRSANRSLDEH